THPGGIALSTDTSGNTFASVAGDTNSTDFPTTPGAYQRSYAGGSSDAFVTQYGPTGAVVYSSYLGGAGADAANSIAVDTSGNAYVTGYTASSNLPTTSGAFQTSIGANGTDAFVTKFNPAGSGLVYSTYLGGTNGPGNTSGAGIALDSFGNAYVT